MTPLLIKHLTRYRYSGPVFLGQHRLLLRPRGGHDIRIASSLLEITPTPEKLTFCSKNAEGNSEVSPRQYIRSSRPRIVRG